MSGVQKLEGTSLMSIAVEPSASVWQPRLSRATRWITNAAWLAVAVSTLAKSWWFADLVGNLRVQLILGLFAALFCCLFVRSWKLARVSGVVLMWQASWIWLGIGPVFVSSAGGPIPATKVNHRKITQP